MELETYYSINDLADAIEMLNWSNARTRAEQDRQKQDQANRRSGQ